VPPPGSYQGAVADLYNELHRMAARMFSTERAGHTLQPTALVNELYLRLASGNEPKWQSRTHFFAVAATTLRRILVDYARAHRAECRGSGNVMIPLDFAEVAAPCTFDDLLAVDMALSQLEREDHRAARVTELRFFAGMEERDIAAELGVSEITVKRDWKFARAWLATRLSSSR
jgi:RNA polymerase sigma factor (TIGR02999 family)